MSKIKVRVGNIEIGAGAPVSVQTMTSTKTSDIKKTLAQIRQVTKAGADLVRVSVNDEAAAEALSEIVKKSKIPVIADIHFNWKLAIKSVKAGAHKIRINPGTIGSEKGVDEIIKVCRDYRVPVRLGLNAASLPVKYRSSNHIKDLREAAKYWVGYFEDRDFRDLVISAKISSPLKTIEIYEILAELFDYPLHIGVTESGTLLSGSVRSAAALGVLLEKGIGDTLRISLSAHPVFEVRAGIELLKAFGLREGPVVISCPTCSRTRINVEKMALKVEKLVEGMKIPVKIAVMGCEVNGPGEARDADIGVAGTRQGVMLFEKGKQIGIFEESVAFEILLNKIREFKIP